MTSWGYTLSSEEFDTAALVEQAVAAEQASQLVRPEDHAKRVPAGPDPDPVVELTAQYVEAGVDHVHFHQIGPDQAGFLSFWTNDLRNALAARLGDADDTQAAAGA